MMHNVMNIQLIQKWITILRTVSISFYIVSLSSPTYLGNRGCEHDHLIELPNALHKLINTRSLDDIYVVVLTFDLYWYCKIGLVKNL